MLQSKAAAGRLRPDSFIYCRLAPSYLLSLEDSSLSSKTFFLSAIAGLLVAAPAIAQEPNSTSIDHHTKALATYQQALMRSQPGIMQNPYVRDWVNTGRVPQRIRPTQNIEMPSQPSSGNRTALQTGDYYNEMVCGRAERWSVNHFPLRVYVSRSGGAGYKPTFPALFHQAMQEWSTNTRNKLSFVLVNSPNAADITVEWVPTTTAAECGDTITRWVPDGNGNSWITSAQVKIGTWNNGPTPDAEIAKICLHELGHAIGLKHSSNACDIMYFQSNQQQVCTLGPRDAATIKRLYGLN